MAESRFVEGAGVRLAVHEVGDGAPVLLVHDVASDAAALGPLAARLAQGGHRVVSYDRRGYGDSDAPVPYEGTTVEEQAQDAAAVLTATGAAPARIVGDGFGALVVLDLMKRHAGLVGAAVLADPPLFAFVPDAARALSEQRAALEKALRAGGPGAAVAAWLGDRADGEALTRAKAAHQAFFADYAGLSSWPVARAELRAMTMPVAVVTRPDAPPHLLAAAGALDGLLPASARFFDGDLAAALLALAP